MNAAMHGIARREALDRLPEIIEFAELDEFSTIRCASTRAACTCGWRSRSP